MRGIRILGTAILVMGLILATFGESLAADKKYPTRQIQVIVPFQPGSTDVVLRPFVEKLPEFLGQPFNWVYKPGAAGSLGATFVASAKPDGYTLLGVSQSPI